MWRKVIWLHATADLLGFSHMTSLEFKQKKRKYPVNGSSPLMPGGKEENGLTALRWKATLILKSIGYTQGVQKLVSECTTHQTLYKIGCCSRRQLMATGGWGYISLRFNFSLSFCCNGQMVGSWFRVNSMTAWIHLALCQWFRLLLVV